MDFCLLWVFKGVVQCGGMVVVELELNIGILMISWYVKDLEMWFGFVLCWCGCVGFMLMFEGQMVYEEMLWLFVLMEVFCSRIDGIYDWMGGELYIVVFDKMVINVNVCFGDVICQFVDEVFDVVLNLYVVLINEVECGIIDGSYQVGIIFVYCNLGSFVYLELFDEWMLFYCGCQYFLFDVLYGKFMWMMICNYVFVGLGFYLLNMELSYCVKFICSVIVLDQELIVMLILLGCYFGFLFDYYVESFENKGLMQLIVLYWFNYCCWFVSLLWCLLWLLWVVLLFQLCFDVVYVVVWLVVQWWFVVWLGGVVVCMWLCLFVCDEMGCDECGCKVGCCVDVECLVWVEMVCYLVGYWCVDWCVV